MKLPEKFVYTLIILVQNSLFFFFLSFSIMSFVKLDSQPPRDCDQKMYVVVVVVLFTP